MTAWDFDAEPVAVVERHGRWLHLVYVSCGPMQWGPGGGCWRVLGAKRAERKARRVLAAYRRSTAPRGTRVIRHGG